MTWKAYNISFFVLKGEKLKRKNGKNTFSPLVFPFIVSKVYCCLLQSSSVFSFNLRLQILPFVIHSWCMLLVTELMTSFWGEIAILVGPWKFKMVCPKSWTESPSLHGSVSSLSKWWMFKEEWYGTTLELRCIVEKDVLVNIVWHSDRGAPMTPLLPSIDLVRCRVETE